MVTVSILTMFGLGLVCAGILAAASKIFYVKENPMVTAALELLPGANCGGCGFAGCEGYAKAVVTDPNVAANRCVACPKESIVALGELTGKTVAEAEPLISMRRCDVNGGHVGQRYVYHGIPSCAAASVIRGGTNSCSWSCLGFGDCVQACPIRRHEDRGRCRLRGHQALHRMRALHQGLPPGHLAAHPAARQGLRAVQFTRQGQGRHGRMQGRVHQVRPLREDVPGKGPEHR